MNRTGQGVGVVVGVLALAGFALPTPVHAAHINVQTVQAIPAGGSGCSVLPVQNVVPYIYDNELNSYDIVIADPSYVAVLGTEGDVGTPFNYITRRVNPDGTVLIHVDTPSIAIYGSLPINLTLLSAQTGRPVCLSVISFSVLGNAVPPRHVPTPAGTNTSVPKPAATTTSVSSTSSTTTVVAGSVVGGLFQERLARICAGNGALDIWFLIITLYLLGVAVVALAEPPYAKRDPWLPAALILVPLVILLGAWYLVAVCRAAIWIPLVLSVIAIVALAVAYVEQKTVSRIIQLPAAKPLTPTVVPTTVTVKRSVTQTVQITTPPAAKPKA